MGSVGRLRWRSSTPCTDAFRGTTRRRRSCATTRMRPGSCARSRRSRSCTTMRPFWISRSRWSTSARSPRFLWQPMQRSTSCPASDVTRSCEPTRTSVRCSGGLDSGSTTPARPFESGSLRDWSDVRIRCVRRTATDPSDGNVRDYHSVPVGDRPSGRDPPRGLPGTARDLPETPCGSRRAIPSCGGAPPSGQTRKRDEAVVRQVETCMGEIP